MIPLYMLHAIIRFVHWYMVHNGAGFGAKCHYVRVHRIAPRPGQKWVTVARMSCRFIAPSSWYKSP